MNFEQNVDFLLGLISTENEATQSIEEPQQSTVSQTESIISFDVPTLSSITFNTIATVGCSRGKRFPPMDISLVDKFRCDAHWNGYSKELKLESSKA